jgi:tetratricopeptide (TPR) repeat protein
MFSRYFLVFLLLLLAGGLLATFGWSLNAPTFIAHEASILRLPLLAWWKNLPLIFSRDFLVFTDGQFRPLSYALLAVVRTFVGAENLLFWHVWLLAFHGLNAILVFLVVRHFSKRLWSAGLAAVLFGFHPLSSVVVNRIDHFHYVLGLSFYLGALCCYLAFARLPRRGPYIAAVGLFVLGLLTSKVVFTLPIMLLAYEVLYRRSGARTVLMRLLPYAGFILILSPFWLFYKPHPLHYMYIDFPAGTLWNSFFSVVGTTGWYLRGLLLGWDIPVVFHEVVERIYGITHWKFLLWGMVDLGILIGAGWALLRKRWAGLGVVLGFGAMLPFASTAWNGVEDYVSWAYLYVPSVGLALLVGGLADWLWPSSWRSLQAGMLGVLCLVVLFYGTQQVRLNIASRSAEGYWRRVLGLNPSSETASVELGKAYLDQGETAQAFRFLFSPAVKQIQTSCLAMSRYYCVQGELLAAAIHLGMVGREKTGLRFQGYEMRAADLFYAVGAPDYAEEALGRTLMADPYNLAAMERMAQVLALKGYVPAAERLMARALEIAPSHPGGGRMRTMLEGLQNASEISESPRMVHPPEPGWLRYVIQGMRDPRLRETIIQSSEHHRNDPVIQMEAGVCLVKAGQKTRALSKLDFAVQALSSCAYPWAMKCWAAAEAGAYEEAEEAGQRAQELDPSSPTVHGVLGFLSGTLARDPKDPAYRHKLDQAIKHYRQAIQLEPRYATGHNNLGNLLVDQGRSEKAIEYFRHALRIKPDYAEAHNNLGTALARQGESEEAIVHFRQALRSRPDFAEAHSNLGIALARQGESEEAIVHFRQALRSRPDFAEAHGNVGIALARQGESEEAIHHLQQALRIKSDYPEAWNGLVMVLMGQRRFGEVIRVLRERLARAPDNLSVALRLAWLLATCPEPDLRNGSEAVRLAERVYRTAGYNNPRALDVLAAAYAETGRFDEAVQKAQDALQLAVSSGRAELGKRIQERLKLYKAHRGVRKQP